MTDSPVEDDTDYNLPLDPENHVFTADSNIYENDRIEPAFENDGVEPAIESIVDEIDTEPVTEIIETVEEQELVTSEAVNQDKLIRFPLARIKNIMKTDPDVTLTSQEAAILIAKATELFIQDLTKEVFGNTVQAKRKTVQRKDLDLAIDRIDALAFLEGTMDT